MENLLKWKKIVTRMDIVGIVATIIYYVNVVRTLGDGVFDGGGLVYLRFIQFLAENTGLLGIALLSFSIVTFVAIMCIAVVEQVAGKIGEGKAVAIIIWNGIWTLGEVMMLYMVLFG